MSPTPLRLVYGDVVLRDRCHEDLEDHRRWLTTETAWLEWDAPWEPADPKDNERYLKKIKKRLSKPAPHIRPSLEICHRDGTHVGMVNAYFIQGDKDRLAVGIGIRESAYWGQGLGTKAFALWLAYIFNATGRRRIYCQTWSGNTRMLKLAEKCHFQEEHRLPYYYQIRGQLYDALTLVLDQDSFFAFYPELTLI